jgi:hypothetical protein
MFDMGRPKSYIYYKYIIYCSKDPKSVRAQNTRCATKNLKAEKYCTPCTSQINTLTSSDRNRTWENTLSLDYASFRLCSFPFMLLSVYASFRLCPFPVWQILNDAKFLSTSFRLCPFPVWEICNSAKFLSASFRLCPFPVWQILDYAKFLYASFLYASFRLCSFPFMPLSGLMEIIDYAGFLYANFRRPCEA